MYVCPVYGSYMLIMSEPEAAQARVDLPALVFPTKTTPLSPRGRFYALEKRW